ncbi:fungal-specific transcription factor domain-containing protein [Penicillium atrosanguineum]|uniref:Fungal-specific transcription factor domain-containing protein n=1 Tax=Penicillium atrosanguineum TaxID=1132637 RepID=A0A9W9PZW3_9EURO|nr:RmlC-like cupin domain-containing protein [Penicillium atrosanguineum]KAJ5122644.1 fungal-specific transcription factor domain-containing protein [Penicillium atrosanguineum]KAJ5140371.1 fungal-specific transcription factor domain-containing protein [Penicillium atrosanguineum]KAJ5310285.1 RmlC-like cupin domain-containing protein [Penicillium atrosanguineum]KAJ5315802.1 fungal-specific transcription factor domain-containing protein [Penicillium atrosanguineum]
MAKAARTGTQRSASRSEAHHLNSETAVRPQKRSIAYLEQLIQDSQELHEQRQRASQESHPLATEHTVNYSPESTEATGTTIHDPAISEMPWFQSHDTWVLPVYISEAACISFASRLCQCLKDNESPTIHLPQWRYTDEATLASLLDESVQWPSLAHAQLLVKTALGHINPGFPMVLRKETLDVLCKIYQKGEFEKPALKCKYFALFAVGHVYSTPHDTFNASTLPGTSYFARAMSLLQIIPERPSMVHIESLLLLAYFCQFLNRFHSAYLLIGNALRLGLSLGLNYNVPQTQNLHPVEREHRVRIWWTIYVLDRYWGSKSGFPVQIHDDDVHVDLPSASASEAYSEQFSDAAYQTAGIKLAEITGHTTREIYSRKKSAESFLQREQKLLIQLKQWVQSLPEHIKLHPDKPNSKHTVLIHLQFSYCVILAIRPVLLNILIGHTNNDPGDSVEDVTPVLGALSEACIHAARYSLRLCQEEWISGSLAVYGYAFPAYIFSSALTLMISSMLPLGDPADIASVDIATEMLKILSVSDNLAAKDLYENLQRVRQCFDQHQAKSKTSSLSVNPNSLKPSTPGLQDQDESFHRSTLSFGPNAVPSVTEHLGPELTTEMALHNPLMQDFLTQSAMQIGFMNPPELLNDFDMAFGWSSDSLYTE